MPFAFANVLAGLPQTIVIDAEHGIKRRSIQSAEKAVERVLRQRDRVVGGAERVYVAFATYELQRFSVSSREARADAELVIVMDKIIMILRRKAE